MKKLHLIAIAAMCILLAAACGARDAQSTMAPEMQLGRSDAELAAACGEGAVTDYEHEGERFVISRRYEDEVVLGLKASVEYMLSDAQVVAQAIALFTDADRDAVVSAMKKNLGPITTLQEESEELDFMAECEKDGVRYIARRIPDGGYYLMFERISLR